MRTVSSWMIACLLVAPLSMFTAAAEPPFEDDLRRDALDGHAEATPDTDAVGDELDRPLLLRDGSHLLHAPGRVEYDAERREWLFHLPPREPGAPARVLRILPSRFLGEIQQIVEASATASDWAGREPGVMALAFELTGQVFAYRDRNYLLVTHPPRLLGEAPSEMRATDDETGRDIAASEDESRGQATAESLLRDMDRSTGPVHRAPSRTAADPPPGVRQRHVAPVPEGTMIVYRRGRVVRDAGGAVTFVFEADASGLADPPLTLLPCLLLHRIEHYAERAGSTAPVLLSGRVYAHEGRSYLLPSVFQIPRERTQIRP